MLNLTPLELEDMSDKTISEIDQLDANMKDTDLQISALQTKRQGYKERLHVVQAKNEAIHQAMLLINPLPKSVSSLRNLLLVLMNKVKSEDITIRRNKELETEIKQVKSDLQKECPHPFVYDEAGYDGSRSNDYEDSRPGNRRCMVCGFSEDSQRYQDTGPMNMWREYLYKVLTPSPARIILHDPERWPKRTDIWVPLGVLLRPIEESVAKVLNSANSEPTRRDADLHKCGFCTLTFVTREALYTHQQKKHDPDGIMFSELGLPK